MSKKNWFFFVLMLNTILIFGCFSQSRDIYVSTDGSDSNSGTIRSPLKTVHKAQEKVRNLIADGLLNDVNVFIRGGEYYLDTPVIFNELDSGSDEYRISYKNYKDEKPVFIGGSKVVSWEKYNDNIYRAKIDDDIAERIDNVQLFVNKERKTLARYPNEGYLQTVAGSNYSSLDFKSGDLPEWKNPATGFVYIWTIFDWQTDNLPIKNIDYTGARVNLETDPDYVPAHKIGDKDRFFIAGIFEELDMPGEFFIDKDEKYVYYWPDAENIDNQDIVLPTIYSLFHFEGSSVNKPVKYIAIEGIEFNISRFDKFYTLYDSNKKHHMQVADKNRKGIIYFENASEISVVNCQVYNAGYNGIMLNYFTDNIYIYGNKIADCGIHAIELCGTIANVRDDAGQLIIDNQNNVITNNYITSCGKLVGNGGGINLYQSGYNLISYNVITQMPRHGIFMKAIGIRDQSDNSYCFSRNNIISYNDVSEVNLDSDDTGGINLWNSYNNTVESNRVHNLGSIKKSNGIYLDDQNDKTIVKNNLVYQVRGDTNGPLLQRGYKNHFENNIFIAMPGSDFLMRNQNQPRSWGFSVNSDHTFVRNIFYAEDPQTYLFFFRRYDDKIIAKSDSNIYYNSSSDFNIYGVEDAEKFSDWRNLYNNKFDQHSKIADPEFIDPLNFNFMLQPGSPAYSIGFKDLDLGEIGTKKGFLFSDEKEIDKIYIRAGKDYSQTKLNSGESIKFEMMGRTKSGFYVDLEENHSVSWKVNDKNIASVNKGMLKAKSAGSTMISAALKNKKTDEIYTLSMIVIVE